MIEHLVASWVETRGVATLLTMRGLISDLILRAAKRRLEG
jgi:hypothetical protein